MIRRSGRALRLAAVAGVALAGSVPGGAIAQDQAALPPTPAELLGAQFGGVLRAMQQTGAPRVQVARGDGRVARLSPGRVVWSSEPLVQDGEPVQRALETVGGVARPVNPLVEAALPLDASAPIAVGDAGRRFTVTAVGAEDDAEQVVGDGVLHAATHADTDTIARAVTGGVETYELIRSAQAPGAFRYRVAGATPRVAGDGVVELIRGGHAIGRVTAPAVVDAAGVDVAASIGVDGDDVVFTVRHDVPGVQYPVLADPLWSADYDFSLPDQGRGGLFVENDGGGYDAAAVTGGAYPGITIQPLGGRVYSDGDVAKVYFAAPPGSTIDQVEFRDVLRVNALDRQTMRLGLYGPSTALKDDYSGNTVSSVPSITLDDPFDAARYAMVWMFTPPCEVGESNCPRFVPESSATRVTVGRMVVTLVDPGAPQVALSGGLTALADGWVKGEGTYDLTAAFDDDGSGVASWGVRQVHGGVTADLAGPQANSCDDRHSDPDHEAFPCPQHDGFTDPAVDLGQLPEGRTTLLPYATDYAGNENDGSSAALTLRLDRSPPSVDGVGGALVDDAPGRWRQLRGSQLLTLDLSDRYSGVRQAGVTITPVAGGADDHQVVDLCSPQGSADQPCPTQVSASVAVDADLLPDGALDLSAEAIDAVGYSSPTVTRRIFKDNGNPAATATGDLTDLDGEWTGSSATTPVTLRGKDRRSGVARLELYARDEHGRRLVDDVQVCDPVRVDAADGETCPLSVSREAEVDLGDLSTGRVTLEAYATDAAGNRDPSPDSWSTYVDHDPPSGVGGVSAIAQTGGLVHVSWEPATDDGSGVAGYEYRLSTGDRTTEWVTTPFPVATVPAELERAIVEVRAKDKTGHHGPTSTGALPLAYGAGPITELKKYAKAIVGLPRALFPIVGGFVCGESPWCSGLGGRKTTRWLAGELLSGAFVIGDIRDFLLAAMKGDVTAGLVSAAGMVPLAGDLGKSLDVIRKFVARTNLPLHGVFEAVVKVGGEDSGYTRKVLDAFTQGGYSKLRTYDVSHDGAEQLARAGNDIGRLTSLATLARRPLTTREREEVEKNLKEHWDSPRGGARSEALGIEGALQYLRRDPDVRILVSGRHVADLPRTGPDIVAYNRREGRLIVVEAKGTMLKTKPLDKVKLTSTVGGKDYVQPSVKWLEAKRSTSVDYMEALQNSDDKTYNEAARHLQTLFKGQAAPADLKVVQVRPDAPGSRAYGRGLDSAVAELRDDPDRVRKVDIIDIPY
ncbi:MAG: hypothetical protein QM679_02525 [Patulibacter sp.]